MEFNDTKFVPSEFILASQVPKSYGYTVLFNKVKHWFTLFKFKIRLFMSNDTKFAHSEFILVSQLLKSYGYSVW